MELRSGLPAGCLSRRSDALQLLIRPCIVIVPTRLPLLGTPGQLIVFHGNLKKPISGFAVRERFRSLSRCLRTALPVVGLVEFTFRIHADEHAIHKSKKCDTGAPDKYVRAPLPASVAQADSDPMATRAG